MIQIKYKGKLKKAITNTEMNNRQFANQVVVCPSFVSRAVIGK